MSRADDLERWQKLRNAQANVLEALNLTPHRDRHHRAALAKVEREIRRTISAVWGSRAPG